MKLQDLSTAVMVLLLVAILLGVSLQVLGTFATNVRTAQLVTDDVVNISNVTGVSLSNTAITTTTAIFEDEDNGTVYPSSYFTWDATGTYAGSTVACNTECSGAGVDNKDINVTYTYGQSNNWQTALSNSVTNLDDFVTWFSVLVVVISAAIILTMVLRKLSGGGR